MPDFRFDIYYVGLTKRGILYIFDTLYDAPESAAARIDLRGIDVRIGGDVSSLTISIADTQVRLHIKLSSTEEFSSWLRQVSDFGVSAAVTAVSSSSQSQIARSTPANSSTTPVTVIRSAGTGRTNDELSDLYGM